MTNVLMNEIELKGIYSYTETPITALDIAYNIAHDWGASTANDNKFERTLNRLINNGTLLKVYDNIDGGFREALYNFTSESTQLSFYGNGMNLSINYCY